MAELIKTQNIFVALTGAIVALMGVQCACAYLQAMRLDICHC